MACLSIVTRWFRCLSSLDREDNAEARGFYLTGWAGDSSYIVDRIGRGMNLHVPAVCLSLLGSTQPGRLSSYLVSAVRGGSGDDGLVQRFGLLVWPDVPPSWRDVDRWPNSDARQAAFAVFERLAALDAAGSAPDKTNMPTRLTCALGLRRSRNSGSGGRPWRRGCAAATCTPPWKAISAKYRKLVPGLGVNVAPLQWWQRPRRPEPRFRPWHGPSIWRRMLCGPMRASPARIRLRQGCFFRRSASGP